MVNTRWADLKEQVAEERAARPTYSFTAERDGNWWAVRADDLERVYTQVRRLDQAEEMARDVTALMLNVAPDSFEVHVVPKLTGDVQTLVEAARMKRVQLEVLQGQSSAVNAAAARSLAAAGYSLRDIGVLMGISFQRAGQLVNAPIPMLDLDAVEETALRAATERPEKALRARVSDTPTGTIVMQYRDGATVTRQQKTENRNRNAMPAAAQRRPARKR